MKTRVGRLVSELAHIFIFVAPEKRTNYAEKNICYADITYSIMLHTLYSEYLFSKINLHQLRQRAILLR